MKTINPPKAPGQKRQRPIEDQAGRRYGRLTIRAFHSRDPKWQAHKWTCDCVCGGEAVVSIKQLKSGHCQSCGCLQSQALSDRNRVHGLSKVERATYRSWKDMRARCCNPNDSDFDIYGGRGITVCDDWGDFQTFFNDMGRRPEGKTLDRIDTNAGYCKANCRWADTVTQANNRRNNHKITHNGETLGLVQWCARFGIDPSKARYRLKRGFSFERVFSGEDFRK